MICWSDLKTYLSIQVPDWITKQLLNINDFANAAIEELLELQNTGCS